jgi:hypothetical protein
MMPSLSKLAVQVIRAVVNPQNPRYIYLAWPWLITLLQIEQLGKTHC